MLEKGSYTDGSLYSMMYWMERRDVAICRVRGSLCRTLDSFFLEVSASLRFPYYFGWNWGAFDECITDLEWLVFSEIAIIIEDYDVLFEDEEERSELKGLLEKHLDAAVQYWEKEQVPVYVLLNSGNK